MTHGGNIKHLARLADCEIEGILNFSANINPYGPPERAWLGLKKAIDKIGHYPDPDSTELIHAISRHCQVSPALIVIGNGSGELFNILPRAIGYKTVVIPVPACTDYLCSAEANGCSVRLYFTDVAAPLDLDKMADSLLLPDNAAVYIGQPNNPTGSYIEPEKILSFARKHPDIWLIIDEAFGDYVAGYKSLVADLTEKMIVVKSLSKFYGIPGVRLGYLAATEQVARLFRNMLPPWTVNVFAQTCGKYLFQDPAYFEMVKKKTRACRNSLFESLNKIRGIHVFPGNANFLLARIEKAGFNGPSLARELLEKKIAIRVCDNFKGLGPQYFRVAVRTEGENNKLVDAVQHVLEKKAAKMPARKPTAIMLQGTSSNAGKSVLATAFCRIILQEGYAVTPFKAQNMSLNSFVTLEGGEMGRAQAVQAQACRIQPDCRMNPILLKPNSDMGAQVILNGKPVSRINVNDNLHYKSEAWPTVKNSYDSLRSDYDVIVLEGAGSPGEVNLKSQDIVNMRMAAYAQSPVLLVGDIDRGGVFASFIGTMDVLLPWEKQLLAGFLVNRFRGDGNLLSSAFEYVRERTGRSVMGVIPFIHDLGLPEEDSVEFKLKGFSNSGNANAVVDIAVVDLPHISNFTDFDAFTIEEDVRIRLVSSAKEIGSPDVIILPGSKNVMADMQFCKKSGIVVELKSLYEGETCQIVGLCGGFQMLGNKIQDPYKTESNMGSIDCLGFLSLDTILEQEKKLEQTEGIHMVSGHRVAGYEIHHGKTQAVSSRPAFKNKSGDVIGVSSPNGLIWGTYLHGVFDADAFRRWFIDEARKRKGLRPVGKVTAIYDIEPAIERLADVVRSGIDVNAVLKLMGVK